MALSLQNLDTREGVPGLVIGTIPGQPNDVFTLFSPYSDAILLDGNKLKLGPQHIFDFESKSLLIPNFVTEDGNVINAGFSGAYQFTPTVDYDLTFNVQVNQTYETINLNIEDVDEGVTFTATDKVNENEYGAIIGTVTPNSPEIFNTVTINESNGFYAIEGDKIKLKDNYHLNSEGWIDKDPSGSFWGFNTETSINNELYLGVGSSGYGLGSNFTFDNGLGAETTVSVVEQKNIFLSSDTVSEITVTPIPFTENKTGEIIAEISIPNSSANSFHLLKFNDTDNDDFSVVPDTHTFFEIINDSGTYKIKLKDDYFYNHNTESIQTKDQYYYKLEDQTNIDGTKFNSLFISALDSEDNLLVTEDVQIQEIIGTVFSDNNVTDQEHSHPWITDIKFKKPDLPNTGREEYQKNVDYHWVLNDGEKIQYSFLDNDSQHYGTYAELEGDGLIEPTQAFKDANEKALNSWSKFIDVQFEEIEETTEIVGDWRIGITDKDHFMPGSVDDPDTPENEAEPWIQYAAYSQGVTSSPAGGNMFYNGFISNDGTAGYDKKNSSGEDSPDGILDWNQENNMTEYSYNFSTLIHEIGHSLGLKHPFEEFPTTSDLYGSGDNIFQDKHDQIRYSVMSYTDNRDYTDSSIKYDGTQLELPDGTKKDWQPITPMLYDVMSLQEVYGPAKSSSPDHNTYTYTPDKIPYECIYDTDGNDVLDLSALTGGSTLKLNGDELSIIGQDYLVPWRNLEAGGFELGDPQGGVLGIINASDRGGTNTEIETIKLPSDLSIITTGDHSTCIVGKSDSAIQMTVNTDQLGVKALGDNDDIITLAQVTSKWDNSVMARHTGNNGKGATNKEITNMSKYLKHDLSLDLADGTNTLVGTSGNDAIFLQNLVTTGDVNWLAEIGESTDSVFQGERLVGLNNIDLGNGDNLLDLSGNGTSLLGESLNITVGEGQDILWLSDGDETITTGEGNDEIIVNGGNDTLITGNDSDKITIADNVGNLTISDFDSAKDKIYFETSLANVSVVGNIITVNNSEGEYFITLSGNNSLDLDNSAFNFI